MTTCPRCETHNPAGAAACRTCGSPLPSGAQTGPIGGVTEDLAKTSVWAGPDKAPLPEQFRPGTLLLGRYRIVGPIGKGGMGSVYRAEDQKLGQEVALKFLAARFAEDPRTASVLLDEVRVARRVSHPNVCRVHDIGEVGGRTFISMEYVDGEDLSSLLRRIGRLPGAKATQIARQLCAGLHAAHERGVLHRDLKPANVMLDGEGNVRITDFGIAAAIDTQPDDTSTGTPAYMAPELFTGAKASVQSDIYSLGLVLFELFTGRPLFRARSMTELLQKHRQPVPSPAREVPDIDPAIERLILRCLERDPERRPRSAMAVLAGLPGGDPLAEALASGKTPSPELIAQAGGTGVVGRRTVLGLVVALVAGFAALFALEPSVKLLARCYLPKSGDVLADRAGEMLASLGYGQPTGDDAASFELDIELRDEIAAGHPTYDDWQQHARDHRRGLIDFWYRRVPAGEQLMPGGVKGRVAWGDPPATAPGGIRLRLDTSGRLRELRVDPPESEPLPPPAGAELDAEPLLEAAGLDQDLLEEVAPTRLPHCFADRRLAWTGRYPEAPESSAIRVEAAYLGARPVTFHIADRNPDGGWEERAESPGRRRTWRFSARILLVAAAGYLAWRSIKRRRGDPRGAVRLGGAIVATVVAFTVLSGHHGTSLWSVAPLLAKGMTHGLVVGTEAALFYFALEPHVRRIWPETMISWSRLLAGRLRDPLVGHHIALGVALGLGMALFEYVQVLLPRAGGHPEPMPLMLHESGLETLRGPFATAGALIEVAVDSMRQGMAFFMSLVLLRLVLRWRAAAGIAAVVIWASVWSTGGLTDTFPYLPLSWLGSAASTTMITLLAMGTGLLPLITGFVAFGTAVSFPLLLDTSIWFSGSTLLVALVPVTVALLGLRAAARTT